MARLPEPHHPPAQPRPSRQAFSLVPFHPGAANLGAITLAGWLERQGPVLTLEFLVAGEASRTEDAILWPAPGGDPRRCDGLWQHTCLEWFVGQPHQQAYWEFNLSPNGDWNVYALDGYRHGLRPDPLYSTLPMQAGSGERGRSFRVTAPLPAALAAAPSLELAVTAVLEQHSGAVSYWALHHGGAEADFHRRDGFLLQI